MDSLSQFKSIKKIIPLINIYIYMIKRGSSDSISDYFECLMPHRNLVLAVRCFSLQHLVISVRSQTPFPFFIASVKNIFVYLAINI